MTYPDDSIQGLIDPWWEKTNTGKVVRGCLIFAFVPYVDQVPYTITPIGRKEPTEHSSAEVKFSRLDIKKNYKHNPPLPVAAMSLYDKEIWVAYKAKKRPCLVLTNPGEKIPLAITRNVPKNSYEKTIVIAPFYGVDQGGSRAGYPPIFVDRIRHAEYPQFFVDQLPLSGNTNESILRFDQMQPVGFERNSFELTEYILSKPALAIIDDWLHWYQWGGLPFRDKKTKESDLQLFWDLIREFFPS